MTCTQTHSPGSSHGIEQREKKQIQSCLLLLYNPINLVMSALTSWSSMTPSLNATTLEIGASIYELVVDESLESTQKDPLTYNVVRASILEWGEVPSFQSKANLYDSIQYLRIPVPRISVASSLMSLELSCLWQIDCTSWGPSNTWPISTLRLTPAVQTHDLSPPWCLYQPFKHMICLYLRTYTSHSSPSLSLRFQAHLILQFTGAIPLASLTTLLKIIFIVLHTQPSYFFFAHSPNYMFVLIMSTLL